MARIYLLPYLPDLFFAVVVGERSSCDPGVSLKVTSSAGYLSTVVAEDRGFGCPHCPWVIEARPGQRINLTLFNFGTLSSTFSSSSSSSSGTGGPRGGGGPGLSASERRLLAAGDDRDAPPAASYGGLSVRPDVCFAVAEVTDGAEGKRPITVCGGDSRETAVYWSKTNVIQIEFPNPKLLHAIGAFVVRFRGNRDLIVLKSSNLKEAAIFRAKWRKEFKEMADRFIFLF